MLVAAAVVVVVAAFVETRLDRVSRGGGGGESSGSAWFAMLMWPSKVLLVEMECGASFW